MLQTDASQANAGSPDARNDVDALPAGSNGPATGNVITAAGTISAPGGADSGANVTVIAIQGEGGGAQMSPAAAGPMTVQGRYGTLTIDGEGNYSYVRNAGSPDAAEDVFTYTIANAAGGRDQATLTILIGKENAGQPEPGQQTITTAQGVVVLPAGVELSDIRVVGRDLVITLPDGGTMTIPNGAVFVPQLVIGDVEVPPTNLAALLIDAEPQPAAGNPQSSGGNFGVDVPPLDPGVPLGDLLPPTEFGFTPPVFEDVGQFIDREPEITIQPDGQPAVVNAIDDVNEAGLPGRTIGGVAESAGSDSSSNSESTAGVINIDSADEPNVVTITDANGVAHVIVPGLVVQGQHGTLTIGTVTDGQISYTYTLTDNAMHNGGDTDEDFIVSVTDNDGDVATASLHINIIDDVPTANDDSAALTEGGPTSVTFDVDLNDVNGADSFGSRTFTSLNGTYGTITMNADGTQTYTLNSAGIAAINGLAPGATLTDTFTYNLVDGDGDSDPATVTITLNGSDDPVVIRDLTPALQGGDAMVDEDDLPSGSDTAKESLTTTGDFSIQAGDGVKTLVVGGVTVINNGTFTAATITTPLGNTLNITGYDAATGVVTYSYTLVSNEAHASANGENSLFDNLTVTLTDTDNDTVSDTLSINIVDDVPTANNDAATQGAENAPVTVDVLANDVRGADGVANSAVTLVAGSLSGAGSVAYNGDGTFTYTPGAGEEGTVTFQYQITDGDGDQSTATVTIELQPDSTPTILVAQGSDTVVDEAALPVGSNPSSNDEFAAGTLVITTGNDTVGTLVVGGVDVTNGGTVNGAYGVLTVTGSPSTGYSYSYQLTTPTTDVPATAETDTFGITVTDSDGDPASTNLVITIVDDVPTANDDAYTISEGDPTSINFDVDLNDINGADGFGSRTFTSLNGTYGNITVNGDGTQTYTLNATGIAAINALPPGVTLTDTFTYNLVDGDGDSDPATVTITLGGTDDPPVITNLAPAAIGGEGLVDEDDLLASRGTGESAGSDTSKESTSLTGTFNVSAADGIDDLTVGGVTIIQDGVYVGGTVTTPLGNQIVFTGFNAATGQVSYTYTLLDNENHASGNGENDVNGQLFDNVAVSLTDVDGDVATDTLSVQIIDDTPTANDDAYTIFEGDSDNAITFDVDLNDVPGADGTQSRVFTSLTGTYGNIVVNADGTQTYTLNAAGIAALNALNPNQTLSDTFTYTLTDGDNDSDPATVVITLQGQDDPPVITNLTPALSGGEGMVDEDDLADGSDPAPKDSLSLPGTFNVSAADGIDDLTVGGVTIIQNGVYVGGTVTTPLGNQIVFTGFNAADGTVSYTYTLLDNENHVSGNGENNVNGQLFDNVGVTLTDSDGDTATDTLSVKIIDDTPSANDDAFTILEGDSDNKITFDVDTNDVPGADGTQTRVFTSLNGTYGSIVVNPDGTQTYTLNATGIAAINALAPGATLSDTFTYTLTDGDNDSDPATVIITLQGTDDPPVITNLTPSASGGDAVVDEDDLLASRGAGESAGSDTAKESTTTTGDFTISAPDGIDDLTVGGINVFVNGAFQAGATGSTPLGNTITFTGYNAATGVVSYSYTLNDNEGHANAGGENSLFDDMTVVLSDTDGDIASDTLSVKIIDDVPTANDDTVGQTTENSAVSINAFANDVFGADGVDTDNSPTVRVTFTQPPAGQGTVSYNPGTGLFTFTPAAGQQGSTTFTYTITDGDGDPSTATVTVNLQPDSTPAIVNVVASVDDDALANGNPGGTDDLDANTGEPAPGTASEATYVGQINVNFGGDTGSVSFANLDGTFGLVGTEWVRYSWSGTTLTATVNATAQDGTTAQARAGTQLYTVNLTPSGTYTVTLLDNVLHAVVAGENDATVALNYRAADSDGDVNTSGTLTITFDDDTPEAFTTSAVQASNGNSAPVNGNLNLDMGADGLGSLSFAGSLDNTAATDAGGRALTLNGQPLFYQVNGNVLTAETAGGALGFTVTLNSNGTYTFDVNGTISNGTETSFTNLTSSAAGNVAFRGVGAGVANNNSANTDLLLSGHGETQGAGTINTDSDSIGVDSQAVNPGAGVRIDFVKNLNADTVAPINASGFTFDNHVTTTHFEQFIPQVQGAQSNTVNLVVTAILADEDQTFDNTPYNADGSSGIEAGEAKVAITSVVINDYSDAAGGGTLLTSYTFTLGQPDPAGAAAAGFDVTFVNGSVVIEGLKQNDQYEINTGSNFSAVVIESPGGPNNWLAALDPHAEAGNQIANTNDLDLGIISIGATSTGTPIVQTFPIIAVDGDGDVVNGTISTTINPVSSAAALPLAKVAPASDMSLVIDDVKTDADQTLKSMNAANNNTALLGAVAAAGLVASPAAAHGAVADASHLSVADFAVRGSDMSMPAMSVERGEAIRSALLDGGREGAIDQSTAVQSISTHGHEMAVTNGLAGQPQVEHSAPVELLQATDMQALSPSQNIAPTADAVVMPSAEMLSVMADARSASGEQGHGRDLGSVLSDALAGGHHGPSIDAVIEAVTGGAREGFAARSMIEAPANHAGTGAEAGASHADAAVPGWDSAAFAGFTHAQAYSMEALAAHPDAAPAAHAG